MISILRSIFSKRTKQDPMLRLYLNDFNSRDVVRVRRQTVYRG